MVTLLFLVQGCGEKESASNIEEARKIKALETKLDGLVYKKNLSLEELKAEITSKLSTNKRDAALYRKAFGKYYERDDISDDDKKVARQALFDELLALKKDNRKAAIEIMRKQQGYKIKADDTITIRDEEKTLIEHIEAFNKNAVVGLKNFSGVNCYMNSIIQAIFVTPDITDELVKKEFAVENAPVFTALKELYESYNLAEFSVSPEKFSKKIFALNKGLECGRQEDAQEAFSLIIDRLSDIEKAISNEMFSFNIVSRMYEDKDASSAITTSKEKEEANKILPLEIIDSDETAKLVELIDAYQEAEYLEDYKYGDEGSQKEGAYRSSKISWPNDYLVIQLKRFAKDMYGSIKKINTSVDFPAQLNLADEDGTQKKFSLYATSNHSGSTGGGHYVAYVKKGGQWYLANDSAVSSSTEEKVLAAGKKGAYLLFYKLD